MDKQANNGDQGYDVDPAEADGADDPDELFDNIKDQADLVVQNLTNVLDEETADLYYSRIKAAVDFAKNAPSYNSFAMAQTVVDMANDHYKLSVQSSRNEALAEKFKKEAETDRLTGIANLAVYEKLIGLATGLSGHKLPESQERTDNQNDQRDLSGERVFFALVIMDLDGFKGVNDLHGHVTGDKMLQEFTNDTQNAIKDFADDLQKTARKDHDNIFRGSGRLARIGGDEFALIMTARADSLDEARPHFEQGLKRFDEALQVRHLKHDNKCFPIVSSMGMHVIEPGDTPLIAKQKADEALYNHKKTKEERRQYAIEVLKERGFDPVDVKDIRAEEEKYQRIVNAIKTLQEAGIDMHMQMLLPDDIPENVEKAINDLGEAGIPVVEKGDSPAPPTLTTPDPL